MKPRIQNEIRRYDTISTDKYNSKIESNMFENTINFNVYLKSIKKNIKVSLLCTWEYPFISPGVYVNGHKYRRLLKQTTLNKKWIEKIHHKNYCMCCESITCKNNWTPTLNFKNILDEIVDNVMLKTYVVSLFNANKIFQHCKINHDVLTEIIKFL